MLDILIATLGQAAPAVSCAFERWREYHPQAELAIIHTDPVRSSIGPAYSRLHDFFPVQYPGLRVHWHEVKRHVGEQLLPMTDINDNDGAWDYFRGVFEVLHHYRNEGYRLHLLVAGGRKEMAVYASTAAAALFRETGDQLWTVHSPDDLIRTEALKIPPGRKADVQLIRLPILPARLSEDELQRLSADPQSYFARRMETRLRFLADLTPAERQLAEAIEQNPYSETSAYGVQLNKTAKTIENQLTALYNKMAAFVPLDQQGDMSQKRLMLADLLRGLLD